MTTEDLPAVRIANDFYEAIDFLGCPCTTV